MCKTWRELYKVLTRAAQLCLYSSNRHNTPVLCWLQSSLMVVTSQSAQKHNSANNKLESPCGAANIHNMDADITELCHIKRDWKHYLYLPEWVELSHYKSYKSSIWISYMRYGTMLLKSPIYIYEGRALSRETSTNVHISIWKYGEHIIFGHIKLAHWIQEWKQPQSPLNAMASMLKETEGHPLLWAWFM